MRPDNHLTDFAELALQHLLLCVTIFLIFLQFFTFHAAVGWLAWALPTNLLMQKFPLNKYLAANVNIFS